MWCRLTVLMQALVCLAVFARVDPVRAQDGGSAAKLNSELVQHFKAGRFAEALAVGERAIAATERAFRSNHANFAAILDNLALVHTKMGNLDEAEALYKRSLAIRQSALGGDHPWVARAL